MRAFLKYIFLIVVFFTVLVAVFPKEKLYFFLEQRLKAYSVTLESQSIEPHLFSLDVDNSDVLLAGAKVVSIKNLHISLLGIKVQRVRPMGAFKSMMPMVDSAVVSLNPSRLGVASGAFGEVTASLDITNKKLLIKASIKAATKSKYKMLFKKFKKQGDLYIYELPF